MANTTNLNLIKPAGPDHALIAQINSNMDIIDGAVGALPSGKTLQGQINETNNDLSKQVSQSNYSSNCNASTTDGFYNTNSSTASRPNNNDTGIFMTKHKSANDIVQAFFSVSDLIYIRHSTDNGATWSNWEQLALNSKITWKEGNSTTDKTAFVSIPSTAKEVLVRVQYRNNIFFCFLLTPFDFAASVYKFYDQAWYYDANDHATCRIQAGQNKVKLDVLLIVGGTESFELKVFYK